MARDLIVVAGTPSLATASDFALEPSLDLPTLDDTPFTDFDFNPVFSTDNNNNNDWTAALTPNASASGSSSINTSPEDLLPLFDGATAATSTTSFAATSEDDINIFNNYYTDFLLYPDSGFDIEKLERDLVELGNCSPTSSSDSGISNRTTTSPSFGFDLFEKAEKANPVTFPFPLTSTPSLSIASTTSVESSPFDYNCYGQSQLQQQQHSLVTETICPGYMTRCTSSDTNTSISNIDRYTTVDDGDTIMRMVKDPLNTPANNLSPINNKLRRLHNQTDQALFSPPTSPLTHTTTGPQPTQTSGNTPILTSLTSTPSSGSSSNRRKRRDPPQNGLIDQAPTASPMASTTTTTSSPSLNKKIRTTSSTVSTPSTSLPSSSKHALLPSPTPAELAAMSPSDLKRVRNTQAARRYRQKKVDRMTELEGLLAEAARERDEWREQAGMWKCEAQRWRGKCEGLSLGQGVQVNEME